MSDKRTILKSLVIFGFLFLMLNTATVSAIYRPPLPPPGDTYYYTLSGTVEKYDTPETISGALVKLSAEGVYKTSVYSSPSGTFSKTVMTTYPCDFFGAEVSKSGYQENTVYSGSVNFGVIDLVPTTPPEINYVIHGYVKNIFNGNAIPSASITIYRDIYEGWSEIESMTTNQDGYYSYPYSTYDSLSSCRVDASAVDYYDGSKEVSVIGTDIDMETLELSSIEGLQTKKYAVLVGISEYEYENEEDEPEKAVRDLHYSDEDITEWNSYLLTMGFMPDNIWIYGDGHTDATEANVKSGLQNMVGLADQTDIVCFIFSGHGGNFSSEPDDNVFLGMYDYDPDEEVGTLRDSEIADIFEDSVAATNFFFLSACHSGGIGPDLMALDNAAHTMVIATCGREGSGWDYPLGDFTPDYKTGGHIWPETGYSLWTYWFLVQGLEDYFGYSPLTTMKDAFDWASANYPEGEFSYTICGEPFVQNMEYEYEPEIYYGYLTDNFTL